MEKTLDQLKNEVELAAAKVAEAMNTATDEDSLKALKKSAAAALDAYNTKAAADAYASWAAEGDAVQTALKSLYIPRAKRLSYSKNKTTGRYEYTLSENKLKINLFHMEEVIGADKFSNTHDAWSPALQKFVFVIANALDEKLGKNPDFKYVISEAAKAFNFAPDANPASGKSVVKALQQVCDNILYIDNGKGKNTIKVDSRHFAYIENALTVQGKEPGTIVMGNTHKMAELVADVMHCILHGKPMKLISK